MKREKMEKIIPLLGSGVKIVQENGEDLLKDSLLNTHIALNDSSRFIVELMNRQISLAEIVDCFTEEYEVESDVIRKDIMDFYHMLKKMGIICNRDSFGYKVNHWCNRFYRKIYPNDEWF